MFGDRVAGWPSLVCIVTMLAGIQLLTLGIIGLYLSKAYLEVKETYLYIKGGEIMENKPILRKVITGLSIVMIIYIIITIVSASLFMVLVEDHFLMEMV